MFSGTSWVITEPAAVMESSPIFTGAMKPYEINPIEATSNLMLAIGFSQNAKEGIYISMHGIVKKYNKIKKDYKKGIFIANN